MTDPRFTDPRQTDPVLFRDEIEGGPWKWIAGLSVLALIAFVVIAGWKGSQNTANNGSPATLAQQHTTVPPPSNPGTMGSGAPRQTTPPPSTTGQAPSGQ